MGRWLPGDEKFWFTLFAIAGLLLALLKVAILLLVLTVSVTIIGSLLPQIHGTQG